MYFLLKLVVWIYIQGDFSVDNTKNIYFSISILFSRFFVYCLKVDSSVALSLTSPAKKLNIINKFPRAGEEIVRVSIAVQENVKKSLSGQVYAELMKKYLM